MVAVVVHRMQHDLVTETKGHHHGLGGCCWAGSKPHALGLLWCK